MRQRLYFLTALVLFAGCDRIASDYSWEKDLDHRIRYDYTWTRERVKEYIKQYIPDVTEEQIDHWTQNGPLEAKIIDGKQMYYKRTAAGLFRVDPECIAIKNASDRPVAEVSLTGSILESDELDELNLIDSIIVQAKESGTPFSDGLRMKVRYTITVDADAVPAGEKIRCWMPYPRQDVARQTDVRFISANTKHYRFSNPKCAHSSLYMTKKAVAGEPTVFCEEFEYTSHGEWRKLDETMVKPYDKESELYKINTSPRDRHIIFSDRMIKLAEELTEGIENPYLQTKAIFSWIRDRYPWSGAREYSTLENISEYVLDAKHGDCGQVTMLLMTLLRIKGIPCHWQSGLTTEPSGWKMQDWCEVYFEGIGWIPVDQSAGVLSFGRTTEEQLFYLGGCDPYRLILNQDYGCELSPKKIYPRSETVDFQRGEVEWKGGNLYFDQWNCDMEVEYL